MQSGTGDRQTRLCKPRPAIKKLDQWTLRVKRSFVRRDRRLARVTISSRDNRLQFRIGDRAWHRLRRALEKCHHSDAPPLRADQVVRGWLWYLGPCVPFEDGRRVIREIRSCARDLAFGSIFYSLTGLHGAHVFVGLCLLSFATIRAFRGHFGPKAEDHLGVEVPGIYWHFVDIMWIIVFFTVYIL